MLELADTSLILINPGPSNVKLNIILLKSLLQLCYSGYVIFTLIFLFLFTGYVPPELATTLEDKDLDNTSVKGKQSLKAFGKKHKAYSTYIRTVWYFATKIVLTYCEKKLF